MSMTDALKAAIKRSGQSIYAIARDSGVKRQSLEMFVAGRRSLRLDKADLLATYFGLELRAVRKPAKRGKQ